jgi:hypothetical protein
VELPSELKVLWTFVEVSIDTVELCPGLELLSEGKLVLDSVFCIFVEVSKVELCSGLKNRIKWSN